MRTVSEVATLAGVTIRTLHHYDEFSLAEIGRLLDHPDVDRGEVLRTQRDLLVAQTQRLDHMVTAVDQAITAHEEAEEMTDASMLAVFGEQQRELQVEAEQRWGDTDAYRESRRRTRRYSQQDCEELQAESEAIMLRIAEVDRAGATADSDAAR